MFDNAESYDQNPLCGPSWVLSNAAQNGMFTGVKGGGSIASSACCPAGTYLFDGVGAVCTDCDDGAYSPKGATACEYLKTTCPAGTYAESPSSCTSCGVGKYNDRTGQSACTDCAKGKYKDQTGGTSEDACTDCGVGKYNDQTGQDACVDCAKGKYRDQTGGASEGACADCATGKYNDELGKDACKDCAKGKYNDQPGSAAESACVDCDVGKYNYELGSTTVETCTNARATDRAKFTTRVFLKAAVQACLGLSHVGNCCARQGSEDSAAIEAGIGGDQEGKCADGYTHLQNWDVGEVTDMHQSELCVIRSLGLPFVSPFRVLCPLVQGVCCARVVSL